MGVHQDFMLRFKRMLEGESTTLCSRQTIICQAILKNADISNPVRHFHFFLLSFDQGKKRNLFLFFLFLLYFAKRLVHL